MMPSDHLTAAAEATTEAWENPDFSDVVSGASGDKEMTEVASVSVPSPSVRRKRAAEGPAEGTTAAGGVDSCPQEVRNQSPPQGLEQLLRAIIAEDMGAVKRRVTKLDASIHPHEIEFSAQDLDQESNLAHRAADGGGSFAADPAPAEVARHCV